MSKMPDIEKVVKGLESHENGLCETDDSEVCPYWSDTQCSSKLSADALAILKKQEPVSITTDYFDGFGNRTSYCPSCNSRLVWHQNKNYCGECGRALKWK